MTDIKTSSFEGWAVVEMFGHQREVGYVTTEHYGQACLFRIDTPELPEREFVLERPAYIGAQFESSQEWRATPKGAKVKKEASPARSKLVGSGSIYAITPCTEETARRAMEEMLSRPLILLELPPDTPRLAAGNVIDAEEDEGDQGENEEAEDGGVPY